MKNFIVIFLFSLIFLPVSVFATCEVDGNTVMYVNGIFTSKRDAQDDMYFLKTKFEEKTGRTDVVFLNGYNESHIGGAGDLIESASQIFTNPISNYDRDTILLQIYPEVTTRKILLVGHSQGTFYTNEIYDYLIKHGEPKEAVSVYNVATPASFVSGDGEYLTSENDKVINAVRDVASKIGAKQPLPANITIPLTSEDATNQFGGHSFSGVYLANDSVRIVSDVETALKKLVAAEVPNAADTSCFIPPAKGLTYYAQKSVFSVVDAVAAGAISANVAIATAGETVYSGALAAVQLTIATSAQNVVSDIVSAVKDFVGIEKEPAGNLAATVYLDEKENIVSDKNLPLPIIKVENAQQSVAQNFTAQNSVTAVNNVDNQDEDLAEINAKKSVQPAPVSASGNGAGNGAAVSAPILSAQPSSNFRQCGFKTDKSPTRNNLIINEVAWMGGPVSANDEWLELKNISGKELDISNWQILDKDEQIKINLGSINRTKLGAGEFILLERTDDNSIPGLTADLIYTGALSNSDEGLRLFDNNCGLVDEVSATSSWPAGESELRKTMERGADLTWHIYSGNGENFGGATIMGTPKKENSLPIQDQSATTLADEPALPEPPPAPTNNHVVISEVQITGGTGQTTNDFIELYNPTDAAFNLKGHRLVKRTKTGTSDTSIKSWTSDEFISAKGFYLWANSGYTGIAVIPDATTTATIADDNGIALRQGDEDTGIIIDSVAWGEAQNAFIEGANAPVADANQSIERKALQNSNCVSASGNGEFLGNNCDINNNQNDFELRALPKPQNSRSFPEPRSAPTTVSNFNASYSSSTLELVLTWGESADYSNGTSTMEYLLGYSTSSPAEFKELAALPATTTYSFRVKEVGLTELFSISAKDKDGLTSSEATTSIAIPSIFREVYFYPDPRRASTTVIELRYDHYPVIINPFNSGPGYRAIIFYKNQDAPIISEFHYVTQMGGRDPLVDKYGDWGSQVQDAWLMNFPACTGGGNSTVLVLKDPEMGCSPWGGPLGTLHSSQLEDNNLIIPLATYQYANTQFAEGSYLIAAFYGNSEVSNYSNQNLIVVDRQKYFFQNSVPEHKAPVLSGPLNLEFNKNKAQLEVSWPQAIDADSLDNSLIYEINYSTTTEFIDANWHRPYFNNFSDKKFVSPGDNLLIGVKAKDDFGNYSIATTTWLWPDADWKIVQDKFNQWSNNFGVKYEFCYRCTTSANLQRISPEDDFEFDVVTMRIKQEIVNDAADLRLRVFHNDNFPDLDDELGEAEIKGAFRLDGNSDITFVFKEPVSLNAGEDYWLVLDISGPGDSRVFYRSAWQNAINTGEDLYPNGEAGFQQSDTCGTFCSPHIPYPNETADWYFKIGLEE